MIAKLALVASPRNTFSLVMMKQTRRQLNFVDYIHPTDKISKLHTIVQ